MTDVSKWIKWGAVLIVGILILCLKSSLAENETLATKLDSATNANIANQQVIYDLTTENADMNQLLVNRAREQSNATAKLDNDIEALRSQLANKQCYDEPWPRDVTSKLREPY